MNTDSNINQELEQKNEEEPGNSSMRVESEFIIKRTEVGDIFYFMEPIQGESKTETVQNYLEFFNLRDIEMAYENSEFSITVIDQKNNNQIVGIFTFNNTPFAPIKKDNIETEIMLHPGLWEGWFQNNFNENKLNGTNSAWLVFYCIDPFYCKSEEILKQIFLKIHLSFYTTLSKYSNVLFLLSKDGYVELDSYQIPQEGEISPEGTTKIMLNFMYEPIEELKGEKKEGSAVNSYLSFRNQRSSVVPTIELRIGLEQDHDDLENIFKDQTPPETVSQLEDFFIAKMIAAQNETDKVLVGQVNDKAIGMLAVSTDVNVNFLVNNFELEGYDNLLKQDYMEAVNMKRKMLLSEKEKKIDQETKDLELEYEREVMKCEVIFQRLRIQLHVDKNQIIFEGIETFHKVLKKEQKVRKTAEELINKVLSGFKILTPELDKFQDKVKVREIKPVTKNEFDFLLETLEYFGLDKGYMDGVGHWKNFLADIEKKNKDKAMLRKKLGGTGRGRSNAKGKKKEDDENAKPDTFDFIPLGDALKLLISSNVTVRTMLRKIIRANKALIAGYFVDENKEPTDQRCFDINSLYSKLKKSKVDVPEVLADKIAPILICFGDLHYNKREVTREVEKETFASTKKKEKKTKAAVGKKKVVKEEVKEAEVKYEKVTLFEVSISEFFKAVEKTFEYDRLLHELKMVDDPDLAEEYKEYKEREHQLYLASLKDDKTEYEKVKEMNLNKNVKDSDALMEKYKNILDTYTDENAIPPTPNEVQNAFCVKLFFIEQAFESRSSDFLMQAFDLFPDKDYLVLTQPHSFIENSLLENFIKIEKKVDSLFGEVLYIIHRESLMISLLKVDYATEADLKNGCYLFDQINDADYMYSLALHTIQHKEESKFMCVVAKINDHIIGICLLSKEANIDYYDSHFSIRDYINIDKISKYFHSRIVFFASHRNFAQYNKIFLKEILRLVNKICLYYEISPDTETTPKFFKDFILSRNRKFPHFQMKGWEYQKELYEDEKIKSRLDGEEREELDEKESDFCLMYLSKKMMLESKIANNNRIVIVGASDTGISFIESLLSIRYLEFSYIYLIAPGALLYHHIEEEINNMKVSISNYQLKDLKKLLLEHRIKIINAKVKDIKPKQKYIQFEDFSILNYDYLVLTVGLQDHLWIDYRDVCHASINEKFINLRETLEDTEKFPNPKETPGNIQALNAIRDNNYKIIDDMIYSIDDTNIYEKFSVSDKKVIALRKNPEAEILLYGRSLNLICFIQGLLKRKVPAKKIKLVIPSLNHEYQINKPGEKAEKRMQNAKKAKGEVNILNDDIEIVNGNNLEDCPEVQKFIIGTLQKMGIEVYENYNLDGIILRREEFSEEIWLNTTGTGPTLKQEMTDYELGLKAFKFKLEGKEEYQEITASLIVTGGNLDVDPEVFKFIHGNGLVYNGRAIINNNFLTANENIFAAGRLCEFSQCYSYIEKHKQLKLESYNSQEVGYTLAKYFLQTIDSQLNVDSSAFDDKKLPSFFLPLPLGCYLPGDYVLYKAQNVKETNPKIYERNKNRSPIIYNTLDQEGGCYLSFDFDIFGIISGVVYFGKEPIDYKALISLVGLHETYLNKLLSRYQDNLIENIPEFLSDNWALAVYHDKFAQLVIKLKTILQEKEIQEIVGLEVGRDDNKEEGNEFDQKFSGLDRDRIKEILSRIPKRSRCKIEREIVTFLSENKNQLP
ncbi:MAG: DUF4821 domain-containing protein, partial [archaeon]|nr:DUF4821 domain-containing protein [archaeon]